MHLHSHLKPDLLSGTVLSGGGYSRLIDNLEAKTICLNYATSAKHSAN